MSDDWHEVELGSIGTIITGRTPSTASDEYFGGATPFITPSDMDGRRIISATGRCLSEAGKNAVEKAVIPAGAVLVSCIGSDMGKSAISARTSITNQQINSLIVAAPNSALFVYYNLSSRKDEIRSIAAGSAQPILNKSSFSRLRLQLPAPSEQHAIADVLGSLDDKIEQNRRTVAKLEGLARAVFKAWFVDFEPVKAKAAGATAFPGMPPETFAALPTRFENSELGPVPQGWKVKPLSETTTTIETGKRPKGGVSAYLSGVPSIGAESITRIGEYDFSKTKYVPEVFFETMKRGILTDGDVLLYKDGGRPGDFQPHVSMVGCGFPFERSCINEHVFRIRASEPLTQCYLYLWLSSDGTMEEMRRRGTGVAIPGLSAVAAKEISVLIPSQNALQSFEPIANSLLSLCLTNAAESAKLATLRDYLLPRLLSGRVRVGVTK